MGLDLLKKDDFVCVMFLSKLGAPSLHPAASSRPPQTASMHFSRHGGLMRTHKGTLPEEPVKAGLVLLFSSSLPLLLFSASLSHNSVASLSFPTPTSCPDPSTGFKCHLGNYVFNNLSKPLINSGKFFHGNMWCHPVTL